MGVVDSNNELHIPIFAVTEERAEELAECIRTDMAAVSVLEYLVYTENNCIGEDPEICTFDVGQGSCSCESMPSRCVSNPFKRAVNRCSDVDS